MDEINGHIRSWADIEKLGGEDALTQAEVKLRDAMVAGEFLELGDGEVPPEVGPGETPDPEVHIRAAVLRYFILGGCEKYPSDPTGVWMRGAHVTEQLDIDFHKVPGPIRMRNCRFDQRLDMEQARVRMLGLNGSALNGLRAQGLISIGDVFLDDINTITEVDVAGAKIGGQLSFIGTEFDVNEGIALNAQNVETGEDLLLRSIKASARLHVIGARVGGQLDCNGANFNASEGAALNAQGLSVASGIVWRSVEVPHASLDFSDANAAVLSDDIDSWPDSGRTYLDGFTYDRIIGATIDAEERLAWIAKGEMPGYFAPQPYTHLAKVLREMGHERDARKILIGRDRAQSRFDHWMSRDALNGDWTPALRSLGSDLKRLWDLTSDLVAGYGHAPFKVVITLLALIGLTWFAAYQAYNEGSFAPNSAVIQMSDDWVFLAETSANPADQWGRKTEAGRDWETFTSALYAADVVIPIIDFGQTEAWGPSTTRGLWGRILFWQKSLMALLGWVVTAIGAAAIASAIRRD